MMVNLRWSARGASIKAGVDFEIRKDGTSCGEYGRSVPKHRWGRATNQWKLKAGSGNDGREGGKHQTEDTDD